MFIHNSRSENGRKTTASAPAVCRRISVATLTFIAGFPQTDFDTKLANFFLKLVLPVIHSLLVITSTDPIVWVDLAEEL